MAPKKDKFKTLSDEEIIRVTRVQATQPAPTTFIQAEMDTQLSIERGVIWLIHFVEFFCDMTAVSDPAAAGSEKEQYQITRDTKNGIVPLNDADVVVQHNWMIKRSATIGTDAGPMWAYGYNPWVRNFPRPLPYAAQNIYFGYQSTHSSAKTAYCRVGYSIRKVSDQFFFRVAQALLG